jgi:hypothetical protein
VAQASGDDDEWERVVLDVSEKCRPRLEEALALAGRILGAAPPKWQRLEAICQEYLGVHPEAPDPREKLPPAAPTAAGSGTSSSTAFKSPAGPSSLKRCNHSKAVRVLTPAASAASATVQFNWLNRRTSRARPAGVNRAEEWMFIRLSFSWHHS